MKHNKFVAHRNDRRGGGVLCLVSDCYMADELGKPSNWPQSCDGVIVKLSSIASVLVVVYRPPDCTCDDTEQLVNAFDSVLSLGYHTTILGNRNMPAIDWCADPPKATGVAARLVELTVSWDMRQMVAEPTRGNSHLDIILTSVPASYKTCRTEAPESSSVALLSASWSPPRRYGQQSLRRPCRRIDYDALQAHLAAFNWAKFLQATVDINVLWGMFHSIVSEAVETCSSSTLPRATYVSRILRSLLKRKKRRWRLMKVHPSMRNKDRHRLAADQLIAATRMYRTRSENALLRSSPSRFYRYVSSCLAARDSNIVLTSADGQLISDDSSICEELSAEFSKNFSQSSGPSAIAISPTVNSAFQVDLSLTALFRVIQDLPNSAAGPDNIPAAVYKRSAAILTRPLLHLFQQSLYGGTVPAAGKWQRFIPCTRARGRGRPRHPTDQLA